MIVWAAIGAIWRLVDGSEIKPRGWNLLPLAALPVLYFMYDWQMALAFFIAHVSLLDGFHGWHDWGYMRMRYTGYAALACALAGVSLWYIPLAFLAGMTYPALHKLYENGVRLPHKGIVNNYNSYCELICGAAMFGGVFL